MRISRLLHIGLLSLLSSSPVGSSTPGVTERVSVTSNGNEANRESLTGSISAHGRYVAFGSRATDLVADDTNESQDIFVHDRQTGVTVRVSVATDGTEANLWSTNPSISADGRYVEFGSDASNLVPGDTNGEQDIFVHDMQTGETKRVSVATDGTEANGESATGEISLTGRYVVFVSSATNLGGDSGGHDIFVHDLQTGETLLVTDNSIGGRGIGSWPTISADGRYVTYQVGLGLCPIPLFDPPHVFLIDRATNTEQLVSAERGGRTFDPCSWNDDASISADGRFVVFVSDSSILVPDDTNGVEDVFVHDLDTGLIERVSLGPNGEQGNDDCLNWLYGPSISADGRFVAMECSGSNWLANDTLGHDDIFVRDRKRGITEHISIGLNGFLGNSWAAAPRISADGRFVVFMSDAHNVVPDDLNYYYDVFVREWVSTPMFSDGFETGTDCYWSETAGGTGCPGLAATGLIYHAPPVWGGIEDGGTFTLDDGVNPAKVFEFEIHPVGVSLGNVEVDISAAISVEEKLSILMSVIAATPNLDITPTGIEGTTLYLINDHIGAAGNHLIIDAVEYLDINFRGMSGGADSRP